MEIQEIRRLLKKCITGEVLWDKEFLNYYSVDSSPYQIIPKVVVIPRNETDVIRVIKIAKKYRISVTARGAGTGLVGNALNRGIILDLKNFDFIKIRNNLVRVGSGTTKGKLDCALKKTGKFFPPNPSIGPYCSIGGMIGNNSAGSQSLKYGSVIENIEKITFVDGNGKKITLPENKEVGIKILEFAKKIKTEQFPKVTKNSSGYRLDAIRSKDDSHKIIVGSEGTLGIIISAVLKIRRIPKMKILFVIEYRSKKAAAHNCVKILNTFPSSIEFLDKTIMKNINYKFNKKANCLLFVEYDSKISTSQKKLKKIITGRIIKTIKNKSEAQRWWKFRDSSLYYSLKSITNQTINVIEDATVPIDQLPELFSTINKINQKFHAKSITYGHAGNGNIHLRLILNRKKIGTIKEIAKEYFDKVIKLGGTTNGEHGDGLARSEYIKNQYGPINHKIFKDLKSKFDPENILNPGKIISHRSTIIQNLKKM